MTTSDGAVATPMPTAGTASEPTVTDVCGNGIGNGNQIISGPSGPVGEDFDSVFRSLTVHPTDPNIVIMGTERNGFVRSTDGGVTWTRYRQGLRFFANETYPEIWDIAYSPSDPSILFAATLDSPGPLVGDAPSTIGGIYKSTDGGETWVRKNCGFTNSRVNSVRVDPTDPNVVVAGIEGGEASYSHGGAAGGFYAGGIYRSTDGGENWSQVPIAAEEERNGYWVMESRGTDSPMLFTFALNYSEISDNVGFLKSADGGQTWVSFAAEELRPLYVTSFDVSSDGQVIYANARDSYLHWVSRDGGQTWSKSAMNQGNGPIAVSPADANVVIYSSQNRLYRSTDGLSTVTQVIEAAQPPGHYRAPPFHDIEFAPSDPSIVYAATEGYLLFKSTDGGATFELIANIRRDVLNAES